LNIRWFEKSDAKAISEWLDLGSTSDWTSESLVAALEKPIYRIRVASNSSDKQQITAVCLFTVVSDECNLLYIAVQPSMRQCGVGRALIDDMQVQLRSVSLKNRADAIEQSSQLLIKNIFLEVRESNVAAIALYCASGFKQCGRRDNYYPAINASNSNVSVSDVNDSKVSDKNVSDNRAESKREAALLFSLAIN
jgi:ribosomal-protein-alanine N-acetyltransferase